MTNELVNINEIDSMIKDLECLKLISEEIIISDQESAENALSCALQSRKLGQRLEESRKEILKPHLDYQRSISKIVKDFNSKLEEIETKMQESLTVWLDEQAENPFTLLDELKVLDGSIYRKTDFTFEIEDQNSIPKEYFVLDPKLIGDDIKKGIRNIPGIKIFEKTKTSLRIKN